MAAVTCAKCDRPVAIRGMCNGHYQAKRTKLVRAGAWQRPVDATGSTRRLRALVALGWSQNDLCRHGNLHPSTVSHLIRGSVDRTSTGRAQAIVELYNRLSMTPGPSDYQRSRAKRLGWYPPLAWDDDTIDDPAATPDPGTVRPVRWDERYRELRELGYTDLQIYKRLGIQPESLLRQIMRYNLQPSRELVTLAVQLKHRRQAS